jgi:hypothetical protein
MRIKLLCLLWLYSIFAIAQTSEFNGSGNNFVEYTQSNLPIIIEDDSLELASLEVFPNPVKSILKFRSNVSISTLSLYNILGQKLNVYTMNKSSGTINIKDLANGIYLIKFETDKGDVSVTKRILKN